MPPLNLNKTPKEFLDLNALTPAQQMVSLRGIFDRDMINNPCQKFNGRSMVYMDGDSDSDRAFNHLIKKKEEGTRSRKYIDMDRAKRLHWIKDALAKAMITKKYWVFSHQHVDGSVRTYIYHKGTKHMIILDPNIEKNEYYLITSYRATGSEIAAIKVKYMNKLDELI